MEIQDLISPYFSKLGGTSKSLIIPALSSSYTWTASAVAGRNSKVPIYILAKVELKV